MQWSIPGRITYNPIWPVLPNSQNMFFEMSALQVFNVIAFCSELLPSTVYHFANEIHVQYAISTHKTEGKLISHVSKKRFLAAI